MTSKKFSILLVDDETDFLDPIAFWLESKGYEIITANNGKQALEILDTKLPDIVFLDINMPVMDGIETLKKIREVYFDLPVIMITATPDKLPRLQDLNISGYFPKKGSLEDLERFLEPILRIHEKMRDINDINGQDE